MSDRKVPRPFTMPWGNGQVVEEASTVCEHHEPVIQLLQYDDGAETVRFAFYRGTTFGRGPMMIGADELPALREALRETPRLRELLSSLLA